MRVVLSVLALLLVLAGASTARADETNDGEATPAALLIKEGVELRRAGKESEALDRFKRAHALEPSPRALAQIGLASKSLRLYVEAEKALLGALAAADEPWVRENRPALELARDVVTKQLASLLVRSNVPGAELYVNGSAVAILPHEDAVRVLAGATHIEVRAAGHRPSHAEANLAAGETSELTLDLAKEPAKEPANDAPSPPIFAPLPPPRTSARRIALYGTAGLGAVGLGLGTVFGIMTLDATSDRDALCNERTCSSPEGVERDRDARTAATWSTVGFVVGAAALATAAALFFTEPAPTLSGGAR